MPTNPSVDTWFKKKKHPLEAEMQRLREIILATSHKVTEELKWSAPTFIYKGNIASFFPNAKKQASLMFHKGALINNPSGLLEGDGKEARVARFADLKDIERKKSALQKVIKEWMKMMDAK